MTEPKQGSMGHLPPVRPQDENPCVRPHRAKTIMLLAVLSLLGLFPFGIVAWVMAHKDLAEMRAGRMDPSGEKRTRTGRWLGILGFVLGVVGLIVAPYLLKLFESTLQQYQDLFRDMNQ